MGQSTPLSQETITHINMVKIQLLPSEKESQDRAPMLRSKNLPQFLPVTIRDTRRNENEKAAGILSFLSSILIFIGFLMVLFSIKSVWDLKIQNWRLCKENAALKKTVRDNVAAEKFQDNIQSEDDMLEFEREDLFEPPNLSWGVSVQIFWSSPYITPCDMNWLARELTGQIYQRKKELDEAMKQKAVDSMEEDEKEIVSEVVGAVDNSIEKEISMIENSPNTDIIETFDNIDIVPLQEDKVKLSDFLSDEEFEFVQSDKASTENIIEKEIDEMENIGTQLLDEMKNDLNIDF